MMDVTESIVPEKYKLLSGSALKLLAVISMLVDHTAKTVLRGSHTVLFSVGGHTLYLTKAMVMFGRLAFPIFCFLLVEGFVHTHDRMKYGRNLLIFAFISEIPFNLAFCDSVFFFGDLNVFFTLFLGFLALCAIEKYREEPTTLAFLLFGFFVVSLFWGADYGFIGYGLILLLYVLRDSPLLRALLGCCMIAATSLWAAFAFLPIALYNGKRGFVRGKAVKYAFYAFYPVHLTVLYLLCL